MYHIDEITNEWVAESTIPKDIRKLERQGWIKICEQHYADGGVMSATFKAPRQYLSPRRYDPNKPKRKISEEHKQKNTVRFRSFKKK